MDDRIIVSDGSDSQELYFANREGVTLHEVALPYALGCLSVSTMTAAVGCDGHVCFVGIETRNIIATLPVPSETLCLAFNEQGTGLACGLKFGSAVF